MNKQDRSKSALRGNHPYFALFMDHLPGGAWLKDKDGRYVYANRYAAEKIFRRPLHELLGKTDDELLPADQAKPFQINDAIVLANKQSLHTIETLPRDQDLRHSMVIKFPILDAQGAVAFVGGTSVDITERKRAEDALQSALVEVERLRARLQGENTYLQEEIKTEHNFEEIIGESPALKKALVDLARVAISYVTVLILGETGTGKELFARAIHHLSPRKDRPLIKLNCGGMSPSLVESELFGHERGAFTGATQRRIGRFELADQGTLFLDEVGELAPDTQVKLLRVLQEGELERVGSNQTIKVDVRIIAATNRNLLEAVKGGSFRSDLFYRLHVFPLTAPPLRERRSDIPLLVRFFLDKFAKRLGRRCLGASQETIERLTDYAWPGNIRELQNIIERAAVLAQGSVIEVDESILGQDGAATAPRSDKLEDMERAHILRALRQTEWQIHGERGAAAILDVNSSTLRSRIKKLGIKRPQEG